MRYYNIGLCIEDNRVRGESGARKRRNCGKLKYCLGEEDTQQEEMVNNEWLEQRHSS
jgi:hypothetical protein